jgi:predicted phage terminase large subunit-like protein
MTSSPLSPEANRSLALRAKAELERRRRQRLNGPLQGFIPTVTSRWSSPRHLSRLTDLFERIAAGERVRALVSVPPQHGKTETLLHGLAWLLRRKPHLRNAYASYAASLAFTKSRLARDYARAAGVQLRDDANKINEWVTTDGGGLLATGVGGPLTGNPVDGVLLVDDPHKNRAEAESSTIREHLKGWWRSTAMTRVHPQASILAVHTRWHPDDLIGWLHDEQPDGWEVVELRAIADGTDPDDPRAEGEALWPDYMPASFLEERRRDIGEYDWASLYDQRPRPRGGSVFGDVHLYTELPTTYRVAIGIDLAYTEKTSSDYSVAVVLAATPDPTDKTGRRQVYYVLDVHRLQVSAPDFGERLKGLRGQYPSAKLFAYVAGPEKGVADFLKREGVPLDTKPATSDKFVRATPAAASWNAKRILLPASAPEWVGPLVGEFKVFTGLKDKRDDQVDAMAAAHDVLAANNNDVEIFRTKSRR